MTNIQQGPCLRVENNRKAEKEGRTGEMEGEEREGKRERERGRDREQESQAEHQAFKWTGF